MIIESCDIMAIQRSLQRNATDAESDDNRALDTRFMVPKVLYSYPGQEAILTGVNVLKGCGNLPHFPTIECSVMDRGP